MMPSPMTQQPPRRSRGRRLALAAAAAVVAAAVGVWAVRGGDEAPVDRGAPAPARELPAEGFADSVGVVVHMNYADTAYGRRAEVVQRMRELGVRHVRDAMPADGSALADGLRELHAAGVAATLATGDVARPPDLAVADALAVLPAGVAAFEGPNELDATGDPRWPATLTAYMPALDDAVRRRAPGVPVIGPSFIRPGSRAQLPDGLPGLLNGHPYPGGKPPEEPLEVALDELGPGAIRRGVVFTETGYHDAVRATEGQPPASEEAAGVYLPRLLLTAFAAGVRRTFVYELLDEVPDPGLTNPEQHFGLLRADLSPKPAFMAIRTLLAAVRSTPGPGRRARLAWRVRVDESDDVRRLTLVRPDGSRVLVLWRASSVWDRDARRPLAVADTRAELTFARRVRDVVVWRPSRSPQPVARDAGGSRLSLPVGADVVLVSLR
jgi:hypothetical protein